MADYTITVANVLASANAQRFIPSPSVSLRGTPPTIQPNVPIAAVTIDAGQPVAQGVDDLFYLADANAAAPLFKVVGIAENKALAGQPLSIVVSDPSFQPGCTMAIGDIVIVSATSGKLCISTDMASGWNVATVGVAWSTTKMALNVTRSDAARA